MADMKQDLYPGTCHTYKFISYLHIKDLIKTGLDRLPNFLADTMLPNINPDVAAAASVLANGGLDPCEYAVN